MGTMPRRPIEGRCLPPQHSRHISGKCLSNSSERSEKIVKKPNPIMAAAIHGASQVVYRLDVHPKTKRPVEIYESAFLLQSKLIRIQTTPRCFKSLLLPKQVQPETRSGIGRTGSETYIPPAKKMDPNIIGGRRASRTALLPAAIKRRL